MSCGSTKKTSCASVRYSPVVRSPVAQLPRTVTLSLGRLLRLSLRMSSSESRISRKVRSQLSIS